MTDTRRQQQLELRRSLNLIIVAITFGMAFFTVFNGPSLNAFARSLGAGDFVYSLITAMPVIGGMMQVAGSFLLQHSTRRKPIFVAFSLTHRLLMIPMALVPLLVPAQFQGARIWLIVIMLAVGSGCNAIGAITFSSWIGGLIPAEIRGRYLSRRAMISTITSVIVAPLSGFFLDAVPGPTGYAILFTICAVLGAVDSLLFIWVKEPVLARSESLQPFWKQMTMPLRDHNYRRFIAFTTCWLFGVYIPVPFFTPFMLEYLHMSMLTITLITQAMTAMVTVLLIQRSGQLMDRFGVKNVLMFSTTVICTMPFIWLLVTPQNHLPLVILVQIIAGFTWPVYDMGVMNFSIWLAPEKDRPSYIALYALFTAALGILPGQLVGGLLMDHVTPWLASHPLPWLFGPMQPFHIPLLISLVLRMAAVAFVLPRVHDPDGKGTANDVADALFRIGPLKRSKISS